MARPTDRAEFREYCLRKLGKPVVQINVDTRQIEDRIDEALAYYWDYHFDGTEKMYLKHQLTVDDVTNKYIEVPENIIGVINIFPLASSIMSTGMFSAQYQFVLNHIHEIANYGLVNYYMTQAHLQYMEQLLVGQQPIRYNRNMNRLYIDVNWDRLEVGNYIIIECYQIVDPDLYADVWKDRWLQNYATAKIKYQWGTNLTKFADLQVAGGVRYNGELIYNEAKEELAKLEEEMISSYSLPVTDMIG